MPAIAPVQGASLDVYNTPYQNPVVLQPPAANVPQAASAPMFGGTDPVEQRRQLLREHLMQEKAALDLRHRAAIHAARPPLQDPGHWAKSVEARPKTGSQRRTSQYAAPRNATYPDPGLEMALRIEAAKRQTNAAQQLRDQLASMSGRPLTDAERAQAAALPVPADIARMDLANRIMQGDTADMANRGNLQRYGSTPTSPDVARIAGGVPLPAQQWGFPDQSTPSPLAGKLAKADAALAGRGNLGTAALMLAALQQRQGIDPLHGPGLTPNLAPPSALGYTPTKYSGMPNLTPEQQAEVAARTGRPDLTPEKFLAELAAQPAEQKIRRRFQQTNGMGFPTPDELAQNRAAYQQTLADRETDRRKAVFADAIARRAARRGYGPAAAGGGETAPYNPGMAYQVGLMTGGPHAGLAAMQAAVQGNSDWYAQRHQAREGAADRSSREAIATADRISRENAAERALKQHQLATDLQMKKMDLDYQTTVAHYKQLEQQGILTHQQALAGAERDKQQHLERMLQFKAESENKAKEARGALAQNFVQSGHWTPDEASAFMQTGAMPGAKGTAEDLTELTPRKMGDIVTTAINQNIRNPFAAYNQMLAQGIRHKDALAAVRKSHPYPGASQFDPEVARRSASSLAEATGRGTGFNTSLGDWLNPYTPDVLLPKYLEDRTRGVPTVPANWAP